MAEFCKQCSISIFGEDFRDLAYSGNPPVVLEENEGWLVICEGCGFILVDNDGVCIDPTCPEHGEKKNAQAVPHT